MAVWWEGLSDLTLYTLEEANGKSNTVYPTRRIPQASSITCSCISEDSSMLAMGLQSSIVVIWDMRLGVYHLNTHQCNYNLFTGLCNRVVSCVMPPDVIAVLKFFPSAGGLVVAIGTDKGQVLALDTAMSSNTPAVALNSRYLWLASQGLSISYLVIRIKTQQEAHNVLFASSGYDVQSKVVCIATNPHLPSLVPNQFPLHCSC